MSILQNLALSETAVVRLGNGYVTIADREYDYPYMVWEHYCAICARGRHNLFGNDGEGYCTHKMLLAEWMKQRDLERLSHELEQDYHDYHEQKWAASRELA